MKSDNQKQVSEATPRSVTDGLPVTGPRLEAAQAIWHRFAGTSAENWGEETHRAEFVDTIDGLSTGLLFNLLMSRINFDTVPPHSVTLGELERAIEGAKI